MENVIHRVTLTERGFEQYGKFALSLINDLRQAGIQGNEIPDEQAYVDGKGNLVVYIDLPRGKGRVECTIPPADWAWSDRN